MKYDGFGFLGLVGVALCPTGAVVPCVFQLAAGNKGLLPQAASYLRLGVWGCAVSSFVHRPTGVDLLVGGQRIG